MTEHDTLTSEDVTVDATPAVDAGAGWLTRPPTKRPSPPGHPKARATDPQPGPRRRRAAARRSWSAKVRWQRTSWRPCFDICDLDGDLDVDIDGDRAIVSIVDSDEGCVPRRLVGQGGSTLDAFQELTRFAVQSATGERRG